MSCLRYLFSENDINNELSAQNVKMPWTMNMMNKFAMSQPRKWNAANGRRACFMNKNGFYGDEMT
jgi:hypothetical protein